MSQRYQEDRFKNIVIKFQPHSELNTSLLNQNNHYATSGQRSRQSTSQNNDIGSYHHDYNHIDFDVKTQSFTHNNINQHVITFSPKKQNHSKDKNGYQMDGQNNILQAKRTNNQLFNKQHHNISLFEQQLKEKDEIIQQLKNIIKSSYQNNSKFNEMKNIKDKSVKKDRILQEDFQEIKELRHNVKILTIENNALSDYIDKLKRQIDIKFPLESNRHHSEDHRPNKYDSSRHEHQMDELKRQNQRLHEMITEKESIYEKKIDQFIISHKSLANQCKNMQEQKNFYQSQNQRLVKLIKQIEQNPSVHIKSLNKEDYKNQNAKKDSIQKIKQQYLQSINQMKKTMLIQVQDLLQNFNLSFLNIHKKVAYLENKLSKIQNTLKLISKSKMSSSFFSIKKSQIYIEEGYQNTDYGSLKNDGLQAKYQITPLPQGNNYYLQIIEQLQQQNKKLKQNMINIENQDSRRQVYTFRSKEQYPSPSSISTFRFQQNRSESNTKRKITQSQHFQRQFLIKEINILKASIADVQYIYQQQKQQIFNNHQAQILNLHEKIKKLEDQLRKSKTEIFATKKSNQLLNIQTYKLQISTLQQQNIQNKDKLQKFKRLYQLLKQQTEQIIINYQLFSNIKKQIKEIKQKHQNNKQKLINIQKQNKQISQANGELKIKYQNIKIKKNKLQKQNQIIKQQNNNLKIQKIELNNQINLLENKLKILQNQIKNKKQIYQIISSQKVILENQLINYLSIFNKMNFVDTKNKQSQQFQFEELLQKLSKIQNSMIQINSSKRSKKQIISKILNEDSFFNNGLPNIQGKNKAQ